MPDLRSRFLRLVCSTGAEDREVPSWNLALKLKPNAFAAELSRLLRQDSEAQAKVTGEIVGLDFDPLLASQDPSERFVVQNVTRKAGSYRVEVYGISSGQRREVRFNNGHWRFVNFHYDNDGQPDDLVSLLKRMSTERHRQQRQTE